MPGVTQSSPPPESWFSWFPPRANCQDCGTIPNAVTKGHNRPQRVHGNRFLPTVYCKQGSGQPYRTCAKYAHRYTAICRRGWVPIRILDKQFLLQPWAEFRVVSWGSRVECSSKLNRKTGLQWQANQLRCDGQWSPAVRFSSGQCICTFKLKDWRPTS